MCCCRGQPGGGGMRWAPCPPMSGQRPGWSSSGAGGGIGVFSHPQVGMNSVSESIWCGGAHGAWTLSSREEAAVWPGGRCGSWVRGCAWSASGTGGDPGRGWSRCWGQRERYPPGQRGSAGRRIRAAGGAAQGGGEDRGDDCAEIQKRRALNGRASSVYRV